MISINCIPQNSTTPSTATLDANRRWSMFGGELLGAHMIGAEVTELIQGYTIGKTLDTLNGFETRCKKGRL